LKISKLLVNAKRYYRLLKKILNYCEYIPHKQNIMIFFIKMVTWKD